MKRAAATTRALSVFVVAFLCLNAGAFVCLGYCEMGIAPAAAHCPLQKAGADSCPLSQAAAKKAASESDSVSGSALTCLMLPVGVVGAPLEAKAGTITAVPLTSPVEKIEFVPAVLAASRQESKFYYRPPPNDARMNRVRNHVFRI
jgi:hypothetical protein